MIQCGADHPGLIIQQLAAFLPLQSDDIGDIGLQNHGATIAGAMFADLHPAIPDHRHVKVHMRIKVAAAALHGPILRRTARRQREKL